MGALVAGNVAGYPRVGASRRWPDRRAERGVQGTDNPLDGSFILVPQRASPRLLGPTPIAGTKRIEQIVWRVVTHYLSEFRSQAGLPHSRLGGGAKCQFRLSTH